MRESGAIASHKVETGTLNAECRLLATSRHAERCARESALPPKADIETRAQNVRF